MNSSPTSAEVLQRGLLDIRLRFGLRATAQAEALEMTASDGTGDLDRDALRKLAHSLAGTCGTFGFPDASKAASLLDAYIEENRPDKCIRLQAGLTALKLRRMITEIGQQKAGRAATSSQALPSVLGLYEGPIGSGEIKT
jgi:HPt (histidine-containing phosphotransfer) domain-containing protein